MLLVISGPSGVGKTTIVRALRDRLPDVSFSVSGTTRPRTAGEEDGADYHFLSAEEFQRRVDAGDFLEHAEFAGNRYGTLRAPVEADLAKGRIVILDIDVQGGIQVKKAAPEALSIFILPPDEESLLRRLRERGRDDEAAIQRRFAAARREIEVARSCGAYDRFIVNDRLDSAIEAALDIVTQERSRRVGVR